MNSDWRPLKLGELITIKHGFAFKGDHFSDSATSHVLVTPGNFAIGGGFQVGKKKFYSGPVPEAYVLKPGDLMVTMTDLSKHCDTLGYSAMLPAGLDDIYLHNQRVGLVQLRPGVDVSKHWLYYVLRTREYRDWVVGSASGSTVKHTSPTRICEFVANMPPRHLQDAIAGVLDPLEAAAASLRAEVELLDSISRALFRSWFVTFGPVHSKQQGDLPSGLSPEILELFPSSTQSEPGGEELPSGWAFESLDKHIAYLNGLALQKYPTIDGEPTLPVLKIGQLKAGRTDPAILANRRMKPDYIVKDGDIIFSWSGSLEVRVWTGGEAALNQHLFKVSSATRPAWFCYEATRLHLDSFRATAADKATTMGHIQRHHLTAAKVAVPPDHVLEKFSKVFEPLFRLMVTDGQTIRELEALRDHLLPRLLDGRLHPNAALLQAKEQLAAAPESELVG